MMMKQCRYLSITSSVLLFLLLCCLFDPSKCRETKETRTLLHSTKYMFAQSPSSSKVLHFKNSPKRIVFGVLLGSLTGFSAAVVFAALVRVSVQYKNRTPILKGPVIFSSKITPKMLTSLQLNDTQLLVSSSNRRYYRASLENGPSVAIKIIESENPSEIQSKSIKRRLQRELENLGRLENRNLMSLQAYIHGSDKISLVYDYMPVGSLEDAMKKIRVNQLNLSWQIRHKIIVGVIKGLHFLHFNCDPRILHYNLKPANVLLNEEFEPRLGDCGLVRLMPNVDRASGYVAPECFQGCRYTDKSDVFGFGMILAVLLTGKDPLDPFFGDMSMERWLRQLQQVGKASEGLDKSIVREEGEEDEMLMAMRIAVVCLSDMPAERPSSEELVPMLTQLYSF